MIKKIVQDSIVIILLITLAIGPAYAYDDKLVDYTALRPAPSARLRALAQSKEHVRKDEQRFTAILGGALLAAGLLSLNPLTAGALEAAGVSNMIASYALNSYPSNEELSCQKIESMSTQDSAAVYTKEKMAAEELRLNAQRSFNNDLDGPYGLAIITTTLTGSYYIFTGNALGGFSLLGAYTCLPKDIRTEDQARLLAKDIENYRPTLVSQQE